MTIDPDHPIVRLLADGVTAELQARPDEARALYEAAWSAGTDDYDACMAAHYLARVQDTDVDRAHWNRVALDRAALVGDDRVQAFLPSLHLNMGRSLEDLADFADARANYTEAGRRLADLPEGPYRETIRDAVSRGLARTSASVQPITLTSNLEEPEDQ